ncbi:MAG: tetratricopeptide repeat protein [Deltaproteobacteria bacterium]|nr:tetratricopeptide repeat protein [Deltaproteobacteria bacterium]
MGTRIFFLIWIDEPALFIKYPYFAEKLADGKDIGDRIADLSPFYLYFLTFLKKIFGTNWAILKLIQSLVGALNALLILTLGNRMFNKTTGIISALLYALYGNVIILESTLEPEVFLLFFNLLLVYFLVVARKEDRPHSQTLALTAAGGIFAGLSIITKPNAVLFLPLGIVWLFFLATQNLPFRKRMVRTIIFCTAALIVVSPVTLRNYFKFHEFILVTADAGKVFFHGNSKGASALEGTNLLDQGLVEEESDEPDYAHVLFRKTAAEMTGKALSPSESSRFWTKRTLDDILADPLQFLKREMKKFLFFFTDYEMHHIASAHAEYTESLLLPIIRYGIIVSLGLLGMFFSLKRFRDFFLIYGAFAVYLTAGMLFLVNSRYRMPAVPYLCLFAGSAVYTLKEMICTRRFRSFGISLLSACVLFAGTHLAFRGDILKQDRWQEATRICYEMRARPLFRKDRYEEAILQLDRCLSIVPDFAPALNLRGKAYAILGQYDKAENDFKKVITLRPNAPNGYHNLGFLYLLQGQTDKAGYYLTKASALAPNNEKVKKALNNFRQRN